MAGDWWLMTSIEGSWTRVVGCVRGPSLQVRVAWVEKVLSGRDLGSSELLFQVVAEELSESGCGVSIFVVDRVRS